VADAAVANRAPSTLRQYQAKPVGLTKEYIADGRISNWIGTTLRRLPHPIDELSRDLGFEVYDRMRKDPQIKSCIRLLQAAVLEDGVQLAPAVVDQAADGYKLAVEIKEEAEYMLSLLDPTFESAIQDLSLAMIYGNRVAEQVYTMDRGLKKDRLLQLTRLKVKPNRTYTMITDQFLNLVGLAPTSNALNSAITVADIIPRAKFVVVTWDMEDSDPRGTSVLNAAYTAWWRKYQIVPEWLRYLAQFGGPSLIGYAAEGAIPTPSVDAYGNPVLDTDGNPVLTTPESALLAALMDFQSSLAMALPNSAKVDLVQSAGTGEAFTRAIVLCNSEMTKSILTQELATEQSRNQARSAAQVHQDALDTIVRQGKTTMSKVLVKDLLRPWIRYNWGDSALKLCPSITLGTTEEQDRPETVRSFANLFSSGFLHPSQLPAVDRLLGLPVRDLTEDPLASANPNATAPGQAPGKPGGQAGQDGSPPDPQKAADNGNKSTPPTRTNPRQQGSKSK
jgi:hypothetical protein